MASYGLHPAAVRVTSAMEPSLDQPRPALPPVASREPSPSQRPRQVTERLEALVEPATRGYSFWADCECPDTCLRDHANE